MLEPVTANQTRFVAPGLSADSRGVALGRFCVILLPSIDRVVGLFRGMSERGSLDDLLPSLQVLQVTTPLKSKEFIVLLPVSNSHMADGIAAVSTLMGGLTFTGSSKHFVKFRDSRAPLGYDVDSLHGGRGDYILYEIAELSFLVMRQEDGTVKAYPNAWFAERGLISLKSITHRTAESPAT